jgi:hypothetical protein
MTLCHLLSFQGGDHQGLYIPSSHSLSECEGNLREILDPSLKKDEKAESLFIHEREREKCDSSNFLFCFSVKFLVSEIKERRQKRGSKGNAVKSEQ